MIGVSTLLIFAGAGVATGIASSVMTALGKGEIAKQGTLAVELVLWGSVIALLASDINAAAHISALW